MKEVKAILSHNGFYSQHYLQEALTSDASQSAAQGEGLKALKSKIEETLLEVDYVLNSKDGVTARREISEQVIQALGYFDKNAEISKLTERIVLPSTGNPAIKIEIERGFDLKGEGRFLIIYSDQVLEAGDNDEVDETEDFGEESFLQRSVTLKRDQADGRLFKTSWSKLIDAIFSDDERLDCSWLLIANAGHLYLFERGKWEDTRAILELDLHMLFELNSLETYKTAEALFGPSAFPIDSADFFHEHIAQKAHKKATEVTKALRESVRESIEILANAILAANKVTPLATLKKFDLSDERERGQAAGEIFDQSLKYVYRMLFLLFTESQEQSKGALPVHSRPYQMGYSLEKLRDLEGIPLLSEADTISQGNFIQKTLNHAFRIYFEGYHSNSMPKPESEVERPESDALGFTFPSLGTNLFDPKTTSLFLEAKIRDFDLQKVIRKMSLAQVGSGKAKRTHRVHYAGLGLNQLGAVYEGLLALKPEILGQKVVLLAKEDKELAHRYVPYSLRDQFDEKELAYDEDERLKVLEQGEFVLTPAGLDRKFSASFYTPEVLTRFLAKEAVEALLKEDASLARMEEVKILEPAMGSGAFLNAVVDELSARMAKEYEKRAKIKREYELEKLTQKGKPQEEIRGLLPKVESLQWYERKAKDYLMKNSVYGVDLNPTAVELAKVSLWLNCLHEDGNLPFLDLKLRLGNSLVGAWVDRFFVEGLNLPKWFFPSPEAINPHLTEDFLGNKKNKFITDEAEIARLKGIQNQYKELAADPGTLQELTALHMQVDKLYAEHIDLREQYQGKIREAESADEKDRLAKEYLGKSVAYNQLRFAMDLWCSLWFWPHSRLKDIPNAKSFLQGLKWALTEEIGYGHALNEQIEKFGIKWLKVAREVSLEQKFFHYDLEFAEVFSKGGFDLVLGNPPWAQVRWEEADFFEMWKPGIHLARMDAGRQRSVYAEYLKTSKEAVIDYKDRKAKVVGLTNFLKRSGTYPFEDKSSVNTYKYFYQRFYSGAKQGGIHAMIAQDGVISDDDCKAMKPAFYAELEAMYRFRNHLLLFDVADLVPFCAWIAQRGEKSVSFDLIDNLNHPDTVAKCFTESILAPYRGMKNDLGDFELRGHPRRIVKVDKDLLVALAKFQNVVPLEAQLPTIHGEIEKDILIKLANCPTRLDEDRFYTWTQFHETQGPIDGLFERHFNSTGDIKKRVMTGPNVFVGSPAFKNPRPSMRNKADFDSVDLTISPDDFFPATVYKATATGLASPAYNAETPWNKKHVEQYRIFSRQQVSTTGARTLQSAILPPGPTHVNSMMSLSFKDEAELPRVSGLFNSLIFDFLTRSISGGTIGKAVYQMTPTLSDEQLQSPLAPALTARAMRLSCVSSYYAELWKRQYTLEWKDWEVDSPFKPTLSYAKLSSVWQRDSCIRDWRQREQALCETDALVAILFGFSKETLLNLYRSQFGVLQKNLSDLAGRDGTREEGHFPRYEMMSLAYDAAQKFLSGQKKSKKSA